MESHLNRMCLSQLWPTTFILKTIKYLCIHLAAILLLQSDELDIRPTSSQDAPAHISFVVSVWKKRHDENEIVCRPNPNERSTRPIWRASYPYAEPSVRDVVNMTTKEKEKSRPRRSCQYLHRYCWVDRTRGKEHENVVPSA